ncbi:MAG: cytochrome c [Sphingomonas sp.]
MRLSLLALAAAASAFAVAALSGSAARADDAAIAADHAPVIQAREAGFKLQLAAFLGIKAALARPDVDVKTLVLPASAISGWGKAIPAMFPPGSAGGAARPEIWTDRAGFQAAAAELSTEAGKLAELAKAGDTAGVKAQFAVVGKACQDCHSKYLKAEDKH